MKRILVFSFLFTTFVIMSFSQIGTELFVGYDWGLGTKASSATLFDPASPTALHMINVGFLVDYEIAEGFAIGAGIGGALPISGSLVFAADGAGAIQYFLDGLIGVSYSYPLPPVVLKASVIGGISFFDLARLGEFGFLVKAKFGLGYTLGKFTISVGAGYEMRQYTIKTKEKFTLSSIPIEIGVSIRF